MSTEEKKNFQTFQDSEDTFFPKSELEISDIIKNLLNPGKVYPILRKCAEEGRVHVHSGEEKFPDIPRF